MKEKVLMTITIWFILNILLVNSQETNCPPDCSSTSKITETSYLDSNSYKDKRFYENSDPNKWRFTDPNFDYSKIPIVKYKELPYTNPDLDHSRLDPQKYIAAMGCPSCSFQLKNRKIRYSLEGVYHPVTGLAKIPEDYPLKTAFLETDKTILIILPSSQRVYSIDTSKVGSATIISDSHEFKLSNGYSVYGDLNFQDGQLVVQKNKLLEVEGIRVSSRARLLKRPRGL